MNRQNGFYWVWFGGRWVVAEWKTGVWYVPGRTDLIADNDIERVSAPLPEPWTTYEPKA